MVDKLYGQQVYDMSDPMQKESREMEYYNTSYSRLKFELNLNISKNMWIFVCTWYKQKVQGTGDPTQKESLDLDQQFKRYDHQNLNLNLK